MVTQEEWSDKDTIKAIEGTINGLDLPSLVVSNYRFYNQQFNVPASNPIYGPAGISSPSYMLYHSMMKSFPLH